MRLALIAPVGVALIGLMIGSSELFVAGAAFTAMVFGAAVLRRMS